MICYLIRHGKDDDRFRGGWSHTSLSAQGELDCQMLADYIHSNKDMNIAKIFSSDLLRAKQTAEIISAKINVSVEYLPQFREINNGILADMKNETASIKYPNLYWNTLEWGECYPCGESPHQFYDRIANAWNTFKQAIQDFNGNVMLITHGGVINIIYHLENKLTFSNKSIPFRIKPTEMISFEI